MSHSYIESIVLKRKSRPCLGFLKESKDMPKQKEVTLTVIVPVYNEQNRIHLAIDGLNSFVPPKGIKIEKVIFSNDGSNDKTLWMLKNAQFKYPTEVLTYNKNRGRGFAVKMGMKNITTDYAMFLDGDMSIPLSNLKNFAPYMKKGIDVIVGSKKIPGTVCTHKRSLIREIVGWGHSAVYCVSLGMALYDFQGGFKVYSKRVAQNVFPKLRMERWGMCAESIFVSHKMGYSIKEMPIHWGHVGQGTKVDLVRDITRAFIDLFEIRKNYATGRYMPVAYENQKAPRIAYYTL